MATQPELGVRSDRGVGLGSDHSAHLASAGQDLDNNRRAAPPKQTHGKSKTITTNHDMIALITLPMFAAAGYSLIYLLGGGGLFGALVIFGVAKMLGR